MAYIGKEPADSFISFAKQDFSTSATTSYTLDNAVANENELALFINFVRQEPTTAYTASGTTLTLTSATASTDDMYCVYLGQAKQTVNAPDGSVGTSQLASDAVTEAKIADGAVENEHLNVNVITGQTAETSIATDDTILIHDTSASALRKMTRANFVSGVGGTNTPNFHAYLGSSTNINSATTFTVPIDSERWDSASAFNTSTNTFTVPSGQGGKYNMTFKYLLSGSFTCRLVGYFVVNGGDYAGMQMQHNSVDTSFIINANLNLSAGDTVKVSAYQDSGSTRSMLGGTTFSEFSGFKIIE
mgnify:CR=1 FL=1